MNRKMKPLQDISICLKGGVIYIKDNKLIIRLKFIRIAKIVYNNDKYFVIILFNQTECSRQVNKD